MPDLRIPFAIDNEDRLYSPATAERGKDYLCPGCREFVIFKQGDVRVAHFAHKVSDICNQETITHKTAKMLIHRVVQEWKSGKSSQPTLQRKCQICDASINQALPEKVDSAVLEYRLRDGFIVDVALMVEEIAQAAVEIRVTHAVDKIKTRRLSIPFIELSGYEIIENPFVWKPIIDNFKPLNCEKCRSIYSKFQDKAQKIAKANKIELPTAYYRHGFCECWKCKREIIVFAWPKDGMHDRSDPKIKPPPKTVRFSYSNTVGDKYWVNTCPYCNRIQGDFYLYSEPDGPFFGINLEDDSPTAAAFTRDMMKIARYAAQIESLEDPNHG